MRFNLSEDKSVERASVFRSSDLNDDLIGEIKPHSGSLKDGRLDSVYYQNPGLDTGDLFPMERN